MKILILGSEGFIGKNCVDFFLKELDTVYGCDLVDVNNPSYEYLKLSYSHPEFQNLFSAIKFDVCINAAGSGSVPLSFNNPYHDFEANTVNTFKILELIKLFNKECKYIDISSAAIYGNPQFLPITELADIKPLSPYGWHKYYSELIVKEYHLLYGLSTCSVRLFSVYGPGLRKQLFWDLYQKSLKTYNVELFGNGRESRDFIFIEDAVKALSVIIKRGTMCGNVYNIASGIETTIEDAAKLFFYYLNPSIKIIFTGEEKVGDPKNWKADISSLQNLEFRTEYTIQTGLEKYVTWLNEKK